jgi:hypothetical protein
MIKGNAGGSNGRAAEFRAGGKTKALTDQWYQ